MKKIFLAIEVLYKGRALASAGKWKSGAIKANLIAFLVALGSLGAAYGLDVSITSEVAATISSYPVEVIEDFGAALQYASQVASTIVVTGSNHTVGDAMRELGIAVSLLDTNKVG